MFSIVIVISTPAAQGEFAVIVRTLEAITMDATPSELSLHGIAPQQPGLTQVHPVGVRVMRKSQVHSVAVLQI